jgi:hypothetical protein
MQQKQKFNPKKKFNIIVTKITTKKNKKKNNTTPKAMP